MKIDSASPQSTSRRLDQWLWFARLVKSRSLAARLCAAGAITINGVITKKANHIVRIGDTVVVAQGALCRTVRVLMPGLRRGPATEARVLYEEAAEPVRSPKLIPGWVPLLTEEKPHDDCR